MVRNGGSLSGSYCTMISAQMFVPQLKHHTQLLPLPNINYWHGARTSWCKISDGCLKFKLLLFTKFIWHSEDCASWYILIMKANEMHYFSNLFDKVFDMSTVHHQEYLNTVYTQYVFVILVLLVSASVVRMEPIHHSILTMLSDTNRTRMTNTYCVYTVLRYSSWWTVDMSKTCRVLYPINMRNSAPRWLSL
jgi:hypothetical protein